MLRLEELNLLLSGRTSEQRQQWLVESAWDDMILELPCTLEKG